MECDFDHVTGRLRKSKRDGFQDAVFTWVTDEDEEGYCEFTLPDQSVDSNDVLKVVKTLLSSAERNRTDEYPVPARHYRQPDSRRGRSIYGTEPG